MPRQQFYGYGLLSELLAALDKDKPVNLKTFVQGSPGSHGIIYQHTFIITTQVQDNDVHYHMFQTATWMEMGGTAMNDKHLPRTESAERLMLILLQDYTVRNAILAMPKSLKYLDGQNDLIRWVKADDLYVMREADDDSE